ncbi:hypothetical protein [Cellulomonas taurus]|jgi:hypothetical protein|uniref:hypothetical protein n=1 Tax=Cellulomonas taurus TaxID=2729175 RepID=UPI00145F1E04|nr:hypothetical protein [Cellulomonas taurus]
MWTMTVDQEGSRRVGDRVEHVLDSLAHDSPLTVAGPRDVVLPFERTVGDEVQAVIADADLVVALALFLIRMGGWTVGIGTGTVDRPLPASSRAGSGTAFIHAREAVEAAKSRQRAVPLAVRGPDPALAAEAEGVLAIIGSVVARRSAAGWAAIDLMSGPEQRRQADIAGLLGISQQAVSARLRAAMWAEEVAARPAAARLLRLAAGLSDDGRSNDDEGATG